VGFVRKNANRLQQGQGLESTQYPFVSANLFSEQINLYTRETQTQTSIKMDNCWSIHKLQSDS